tara:strand:- start:320 stop:580 length:261 start_codon:yes stop_codon:yes gene_type:complete
VEISESNVFLNVNTGDYVVIDDDLILGTSLFCDNWVAYVICAIPGARNPVSKSLFQVMNVDTFVISIINADSVVAILVPDAQQPKY